MKEFNRIYLKYRNLKKKYILIINNVQYVSSNKFNLIS